MSDHTLLQDDDKPEAPREEGLVSKMLETRTVLTSGQVDERLAERVISQLLILNAVNHDPIRMIITSQGGHIDSGYAIHDMMKYVESPMISQMKDYTSSSAFRVSGAKAFGESGISHDDVDHIMIYDAFAHLPIFGLEDLGFCQPGEAASFIRERNTAPGGKLPLNTNGGGLSYAHSGMYGMFALQESVRQMRGVAPAQVEGAKISVCHGVGGMFAASGTIVFSNEAP